MPFLRAALIPHKPSVKHVHETEARSIQPDNVRDLNWQIALHNWMADDDQKSLEELTRLGLA